LHVENGACTATLVWGSKNYDYMRIGETRYLPLPNRETSTFEIPVEIFDRNVAVIADTVAMSEPHEIEYRLLFSSESLQLQDSEADSASESGLRAAEQFRVDYREDGSALLTLGEKERYLLLDREAEIPADAEGLTLIRIPVERVYAASSSVPDLFLHCGALDRIRFTSTAESSWRLPELQEAMQKERLLYAGKYNAPDYELLLEENCDLVIENTMILHKPEVKEKLEALGLPVIIEYSSYEPEPLGRVEWIRLYGLLTGHPAEADVFFQEQSEVLERTVSEAPTGKTAAFFHIASNGAAVVRRSGDYVTRMIELAGGRSPFTDLPEEDNALSTITIQMESFYAQARDADVLIYNSTVSGDLERMQDLLAKSSLFEDFKAVQNGEVWCTEQSMFQQSSATAGMIADIHTILSGEAEGLDQLTWLHRIR
ncbi:MAG: ABC transporter substrate-binding protein, partial [Oscillospiraceae bacterium]|nr:ABC transporter substrate-binding protein [Oscillospiraceae bacterium]